jgi:hypothetical protein
MPCYHPIKAYQSRVLDEKGRPKITLSPKEARDNSPLIPLKCGGCVGCQMARSKEWALRCIHEAQLHEDNCFITLTYDEEHLPACGSLMKSHFQKFMKRLRKKFGKVRFFHCGEYGEKRKRPHYHALLFGLDFRDKEVVGSGPGGPVFTSKILSDLWGKGFVTVGAVTIESAAYCARYVLKKQYGAEGKKAYEFLEPEYITMSRRPGVGAGWLDRFKSDVFPHDYVVHDGRKNPVPRYYSNLVKAVDPELYELVQVKRIEESKKAMENPDFSCERLIVREKVQILNNRKLKRSYEDGSGDTISKIV